MTRDVATFVRSSREALALQPTDLCGDIRAAAGTSFAQVPSATTRFIKAVSRIKHSLDWPELFQLMAPYTTGPLHARATTYEKLDTKSRVAINRVLRPQFDRLGTVLLGPGA